jgi:GntR family transcriptional regulator
MAPRISRAPMPFMQIAEHYRQMIRDGELAEGHKLDSIRSLAAEWDVSPATVAKALGQLQVEGFLRSSTRGTFVEDLAKSASSPHDRLLRVRKLGTTYGHGEWTQTLSAKIMKPPNYVADLFGFEDPNAKVIRRESVTMRAGRRAELVVTWHPAEYAELVPALLEESRNNKRNEGKPLIEQIEESLGKRLTRGRDDIEAREADEREAGHLGLKVGAPTLCVVHRWSAGDDLVEYGERCLPPKHAIAYAYDLEEE